MAVYTYDSPFLVVVRTDSYTGNFERDFCAFVTGVTGDCDVGSARANDYLEEEESKDSYDFWDSLDQVADDRGCRRPVSVYTDDKSGNSLVIFFHYDPTFRPKGDDRELEIDIIKRRAARYFSEHRPTVKLLDIEVFKNEVKRVKTKIA